MWILIAAVLTTAAIGVVLGWLLARRLKEIEPSAFEEEPEVEPVLDDEIEERIDALSSWLAQREGRLSLKPLFASKLRLAYLLRDLPRDRRENS